VRQHDGFCDLCEESKNQENDSIGEIQSRETFPSWSDFVISVVWAMIGGTTYTAMLIVPRYGFVSFLAYS